jgi:hypothetical protein
MMSSSDSGVIIHPFKFEIVHPRRHIPTTRGASATARLFLLVSLDKDESNLVRSGAIGFMVGVRAASFWSE